MTRRILILAMAFLLCGSTLVIAQINDATVSDDNIPPLPTERPWLQWALVGIFIVGAIGLGVFSSKRTHE